MSISIRANGMVSGMGSETMVQGANQGKKTVFAGNTNLTADPIAQRRQTAQKQAYQLIKDVENEMSIAEVITSREEHYAKMGEMRKSAQDALTDIHEDEKVLQQLYEVRDDSQEQQDLELLKKRADYKNHVGSAPTKEERERLAEIDRQPLTEYQKRALELNDRAAIHKKAISEAERMMQDDTRDVKSILIEKLKSSPMLDAKNAADDIMEAANEEIIGMLTEEAVDHIEEKQKEEQEKAQEAADKKEQEDEQLEELAEKRAMEEAMIEKTKEAVERAKDKHRQNELPDMEFGDMVELTRNQNLSEDTAQSLQEIKNSMKLLEADLKGIKVDEEV